MFYKIEEETSPRIVKEETTEEVLEDTAGPGDPEDTVIGSQELACRHKVMEQTLNIIPKLLSPVPQAREDKQRRNKAKGEVLFNFLNVTNVK